MSDYSTNPSGGSGTTLTAFFDSRSDAEGAMDRLRSSGVSESCMHLTEGAQNGGGTASGSTQDDKGFFESLGDFFFPEEDRHAYAEGLSRGGYLLTVRGLSEGQYDTVLDILDDSGTVDIDEREATWRSEGWSGYQGSSAAAGGQVPAAGFAEGRPSFEEGERTLSDDETIDVVEERVRIGKRDTSHGRVRVRSYVREVPVEEQVDLTSERVEIERRPVDRAASRGDDAFRERSIEAEEFGEEAVVSKEAHVTEEISLRRERETHRETISDTERHTEVEIDDDRAGGASVSDRDRKPGGL